MPVLDYAGVYREHVRKLMNECPGEAMSLAVGGKFESIGDLEFRVMQRAGLRPDHYLLDVGCGSGRLAKPLAGWLTGRYLGIDVVPDLLRHAREICARPDWRFELVYDLVIPEQDAVADVACFFSVFTHLVHQDSYRYLRETRRVLKAGGLIVFSFLEFGTPGHWAIFESMVDQSVNNVKTHHNQFIERNVIVEWAQHLNLEVVEILPGDQPQIEGEEPRSLGQSVCILRKP